MRRVLFPLFLALAVVQSVQRADACGDKFLLVGRGVRFQHAYAAIYPARILIYADPLARGSEMIRDPRFQAVLARAGHKVSSIATTAAFGQALKSSEIDLVLVDWASLPGLQVADAASKPVVLPVMSKPTKAETEACRQQYNCQLKDSDRVEQYLNVIENTMKVRIKSQQAQKKSS